MGNNGETFFVILSKSVRIVFKIKVGILKD